MTDLEQEIAEQTTDLLKMKEQTTDLLKMKKQTADIPEKAEQVEDLLKMEEQTADIPEKAKQVEDLLKMEKQTADIPEVAEQAADLLEITEQAEDLPEITRQTTDLPKTAKQMVNLQESAKRRNAEQDIYFMPLGGGQRVGASCYYLRLGNANIILDAGIGKEKGVIFEPDLHSLVTSFFIQSLSQINQIYISHAHADHIGYLLRLMSDTSHASVYMTEITALLSEYQLYDKTYLSGANKDEDKRLAAQHMLNKVAAVSYMQQIDFGSYKATFLPAGHIPGAMMVLFECGKRRILYTGDYSLKSTALTNGCFVPDDFNIDTVIMCGLHAKHPAYLKKSNALFRTVQYVLHLVEQRGMAVRCYVPQLSKGIEFIKTLNEWNKNHIPVYLDESVMNIVTKMEQLSIPILTISNKVMGKQFPMEPHIYITANPARQGYGFYQEIKIDFSLHEDFSEMKEFIKKINPKQAVLIHCAKEYSPFDATIEQTIMLDGECRTQFIFAEEKELYKL